MQERHFSGKKLCRRETFQERDFARDRLCRETFTERDFAGEKLFRKEALREREILLEKHFEGEIFC